jgi:hypothetical protein
MHTYIQTDRQTDGWMDGFARVQEDRFLQRPPSVLGHTSSECISARAYDATQLSGDVSWLSCLAGRQRHGHEETASQFEVAGPSLGMWGSPGSSPKWSTNSALHLVMLWHPDITWHNFNSCAATFFQFSVETQREGDKKCWTSCNFSTNAGLSLFRTVTDSGCLRTKCWGEYLKPNVVVKWLTLVLRIREVPGSNLGQQTGYPDWSFSWFPSVSPGKCCNMYLQLGHDRFLPNPFQVIIHVSYIRRYSFSFSYWNNIVKETINKWVNKYKYK